MVLLNYDEKIKEIENNLESWSKKILTPLGNITVVKSLSLCYLNWWYSGSHLMSYRLIEYPA